MKKKLAFIAGSCVILAAGAAQAAAPNAPYVAAGVGVAWLDDAGMGSGLDAEFDAGYGVVVAAGYAFDAVRAELELGYRKNDIDRFSVVGIGVPASGDVTSQSIMANLYYDFTPTAQWSPFVGAGIGMANVELNDAAVIGIPLGDDDDTVFAWQLMAGIGFKLTDNTSLDISYRYFATADPEFSYGVEGEYESHNLMAGVRVCF